MIEKYTLSEPTQEEKELFLKEFQELLDKYALYFEPVPQFIREGIADASGKAYPWNLTCQIFLQKKTALPEETKEEATNDESPKEA